MRYDLEIGTPEAPTWEQLAAWAVGVELRLEAREGGLAVAADDALLFTLDAAYDPQVGRLDVDLDGRVLDQDPHRREAVVDLFRAVAGDIGAFFAAAQVEPGWIVTHDYRLGASAETLRDSGEHVLARGRWQGLPPVPMWLSWFGAPYAGLVSPHLPGEASADGLFVRLGAEPRPAPALGAWPLPVELTYRRRAPIVHGAGVRSNPPEPGDRAAVIPPLA